MNTYLYAIVVGLTAASLVHADSEQVPDPKSSPGYQYEQSRILEAQPVGPYNQPEWTTARRFPNTRVYLQQQPWGFGVEQWVKAQWPRGEAANYLFQEEMEIGLPYRTQIDLYENWRIDDRGKVFQDSTAAEIRWALADWGKIWGNPTLYGEWKFAAQNQGADAYELKLLLGDEITPRLHWGFNGIYEQETGGGRATEIGGSFALSYTVIDEKFSAGMELKIESETEKGARDNAPLEIDLGPSIQWRPTKATHVDVAPLIGLTSDSPHVELWVVFGWNFGPGNEAAHAPVSLQSY
ncbi:MAG: hypothetical protein WCS70_15855 [Verrucomicrobiota bacterium]